MADRIEIEPVAEPIVATIRPPGSKSITNRALVCGAFAYGDTKLTGVLDSDDTQVMMDCLRRLGYRLKHDPQRAEVIITGTGGDVPVRQAELFVGNSGTTIRFLVSMLSSCRGKFVLDGVPRMRERPIGHLLDALRQLGANVSCQLGNDCPPVIVDAYGLRGGTARIRGEVSSQFLSGLIMACPYAEQDVEILVSGELVSQPYVHMTLGMMNAFGIRIAAGDLRHFHIPGARCFQATEYAIEPDASSASYFWAAAAITEGKVTVRGLTRHAIQGDVGFCDCLAQMGCEVTYEDDAITVTAGKLRGISADMNAISDTVQTLAAVSLFADGPTTITGVGHIRHKETDRIGDLARELRKLGADVDERPDGLKITPRKLRGATMDTYHDHRMAMSLSLVGLRVPGIVIKDPACTNKTYPTFFEDMRAVRTRNSVQTGN